MADGQLQIIYTPATQPGTVTIVSTEDRVASEAARDASEQARDAAIAAQQAAEAAEGTFTAPANDVVATMVTDAGPTNTALSATFAAAGAGQMEVARLDRDGLQIARRTSAEAAIEYSDAVELTQPWDNLTGWVNGNVAVGSNRLYGTATSTTNGALHSFPVPVGGTAHIATIMHWVPGATAPLYFGLDLGASDHALVNLSTTSILIGLSGAGARGFFRGSSLSAIPVADPVAIGAEPTVATDFYVSIDITEQWVSFSMHKVGSTDQWYSFKVERAAIAAAGYAINNIHAYVADARGAVGHTFGPVVATHSLQPARTKMLGGQQVEGVAARHVVVYAPETSDRWRIALPPSYDPRKPAPVVLYHHQSLTGSETTAWNEARMQPVSAALSDAGFIVASARDVLPDRWGNQDSLDNFRALYEYVREHFSTGPLFLFGVSMGSLPVLNALTHHDLPTPAAIATVGGVVDLDVLYANATYAPYIRTAFGVASDGSDYEAKTAGYNPADRDGVEFRGVPMRLYTSPDDTTVPMATNQNVLAALTAPYSPEAAVIQGTGAHLATNQFQAADLVSFFSRYL